MEDGGERGARNGNRGKTPRVHGHVGPPKFVNRRAIAASTPGRPDWILLTRVRPLSGAFSFAPSGAGAFVTGGRPFAPRVSIDRAALPGAVRLQLGCDFDARLARATQLASSMDVRGGFPGVAFALLYGSCAAGSQRGDWMRTPAIKSLDRVSLEEALAYLDASEGDELGAAFALATHRNELYGSAEAPDDAEVHHALFLLRKARGLDAPSFDLMRVQLKRRVAA